MLRLYTCIVGQHDLRLVALATAICILSSYAAIDLLDRARQSSAGRRRAWARTAAAVFGAGIWATHFLAELAYNPGLPLGYDIRLTALSLAAAVALAWLGITVALRHEAPLLGGGILGAAVAVMHYTGTAALRLPASIHWDVGFVLASLAVGIGFCAAATRLVWPAPTLPRRALGAALLVAAICGAHFVGMAGVTLEPDPRIVVAGAIVRSGPLVIAVAVVILLIVTLALAGLVADARLAPQATREAARLRESEARLRRSQQHLALAQRVSQTGSVLHDIPSDSDEWSDEAYRVTGLTRGAQPATMESFRALVLEEDRAPLAESKAAMRRGEQPPSVVYRIRRPDGEARVIQVDMALLSEDDGAPSQFVITLRDITELHAAEQKLRRSQQHLALAQRVSRTGSVWHDVKADVGEWSDELYRILGIERGARPPTFEAFLEFVHGEDRAALFENMNALYRGERWSTQEYRIVQPDGGVRVIDSDVETVFDDAGQPSQLVVTLRDVTELRGVEARLRSAREALSASERQYRSVVDNLNEVVFQSDEGGRWTFLNPAWSEITGLSIEESLGRSAFTFVDPRDRPLYVKCVEAAFAGESDGARHDFRFRAKDGGVRWLDLDVGPMYDDQGHRVGLLGTLNDVTQRHAAEDALREARDAADRATRAKSEFLASMSHEIRSPMNGVIGIVDLLRDTELSADQQQMVDLVHESAASLLCILDDILDFSKIEAGAISITLEPTALRRLTTSVREATAFTASAKGLALEVEVEPDVPDLISTDPLRLRQILVNLLSNAVKFTNEGSVTVRVSQQVTDAAAAMLAISVTGTGIGMDQDVMARLFMPFTQGDASTTRIYGGTGLGLSISRRLARLLGGDLTIASEPGKGSTFTLRLPLVLAEGTAGGQPGETRAEAPVTFAGGRVLVAEDMATNRWGIRRQLARLGLNGHLALAALARSDYDLLITDFHMPGMDGLSLASHIRSAEARDGGKRLPILGLTADITGSMRERCLAAGMDDVVLKPTNIQRLAAAIRPLLLLGPHEAPAEADTQAAEDDRVFDTGIYRELIDDAATGREWLQEFLDSAASLVDGIGRHAAARDREALAAAAHQLAGAALSTGAARLGLSCRRLEAAAPAADAPSIDVLARTVDEDASAMRIEILHFIATQMEQVA